MKTGHRDLLITTGGSRSVAIRIGLRRTWRRLGGEHLLPKVIEGVTFKDGVELVKPSTHAAT